MLRDMTVKTKPLQSTEAYKINKYKIFIFIIISPILYFVNLDYIFLCF